jgi:hypothetical protein
LYRLADNQGYAQAQFNLGYAYLIKFDTDSSAVCLDGTPGGYYYRKGTDNVWLIEAEGGAWAVSLSDCLARSKTDLGSSSGPGSMTALLILMQKFFEPTESI